MNKPIKIRRVSKIQNDHPQTLSGQDSDFFKNQGLSVGDEKNSEINQISVDHKDITLSKGQSETIDGIHITHADTDKMTDKERNVMKINSDNKVIIDLQHDQYQGKEITVTYDNLNNSYYLENIDDKTNKIKISKIERTFHIFKKLIRSVLHLMVKHLQEQMEFMINVRVHN